MRRDLSNKMHNEGRYLTRLDEVTVEIVDHVIPLNFPGKATSAREGHDLVPGA